MKVFTVYFDTPDMANEGRTWTVASVHVRAFDVQEATDEYLKWHKANPDNRKFREARELVCINDVEAVQCGAV